MMAADGCSLLFCDASDCIESLRLDLHPSLVCIGLVATRNSANLQRILKIRKEMDYVAHVVIPTLNLAFAVTLVGLGRYSVSLILFASLLCISAELVLRNIVSFSDLYELKMNSPVLKRDRRGS